MRSLFREHFPLTVLASAFLALASMTHCTSTAVEDPTAKPVGNSGQSSDAQGEASAPAADVVLITGEAGRRRDETDASEDHAVISPPEGGVCDIDASVDGSCPLPPSVCVDAHWLAYFVNPGCSAEARCEWEVRYRKCMVYCSDRGCINNITA
ncbi:MAG TPA: hypothetical protein VK540_10480 [Polyangiaceae bacterium]|jgi:hypothetical protein|nr:hypothetical protein [Polyangiaceae bacterium]